VKPKAEKPRETRDVQGRFVPGVSGNIEGRGPDTPEDKIRKKAVKQVAEEYMEKLSAMMEKDGAAILANLAIIAQGQTKSAVNAAKELHDRFMGKAPQSINVSKTPDFTFEDDLIVE
jgi:uncharacterized protein (UPF0254 family)